MSGNAVPPFKGTITAGSSPVRSTKIMREWTNGKVAGEKSENADMGSKVK